MLAPERDGAGASTSADLLCDEPLATVTVAGRPSISGPEADPIPWGDQLCVLSVMIANQDAQDAVIQG